MQTIEINLYKFSELSKEVQQKVIEKFREKKYNDPYISHWAIDDCYLFEPKHEELVNLFGEEYVLLTNPILGNTRDFYFDLERNRHIDATDGIVVNNERMFLKWLGIDYELQENVYYNILKTLSRYPDTCIEFEPISELTGEEIEILSKASEKFDEHMNDVLNKIEEAVDYQYSYEFIIEEIYANDYDFTENGEIY